MPGTRAGGEGENGLIGLEGARAAYVWPVGLPAASGCSPANEHAAAAPK
jgi:hypothetical protein